MTLPSLPPHASRRAWLAALAALGLAGCGENLTVPDRDPATSPEPAPLACVPNLDGVLAPTEVAVALGTPVRFTVSPAGVTRPVDLAGTLTSEGVEWSLATDYADDQALVVTPALASERWYSASFPSDAFVTPFDPGGRVESIGRVGPGGLELLGLASSEPSPPEGTTLLVYSPPILALALPAAPGDAWVSVGNVANGTVRGLPYASKDTYEVSVVADGALDLPWFTFDRVLRVATKVTVEPAVGAAVTRRQTSFFSECFAEVARATSLDGETHTDFTVAAELRRLGF